MSDDFEDVPPPPDPLADLIERAKADPTIAHSPEVIAALHDLKSANRAYFVKLLKELRKNKGVSITDLREQLADLDDSPVDFGDQEPAAKKLLRLVEATNAHFFAAPFLGDEDKPFVDFVNGDGHRVTALVNSKTTRRWLAGLYYQAERESAPEAVLATVLLTLESRAVFEGHRHPVYVRLGQLDGTIYIDLGDATWSAIEVDKSGWRIVPRAPVRFVRSISAMPLPVPVRGGTLQPLSELLNVDDQGLKICTGWLLETLNPFGPYPPLVVVGQQGRAKTTLIRVLRRLTDPNRADVRPLPDSKRDLLVGAQWCWIQAFDNLSSILADMSDALCMLSTGGADVRRALYTDADEVVLSALRPVCMTGITEIVTRPDLMDRSVFVTPKELTDYIEDKVFWARVDAAVPSLLGALLDVVVAILRKQATAVETPMQWRMADFVRWVSHGEEALGWQEGAFAEAYATSRERAVLMVIEADPLASAFVAFMQETYTETKTDLATGKKQTLKLSRKRGAWSGTATELYGLLGNLVGGGISVMGREWPRSHGALGQALARIIPPLKAIGLLITTDRTATERTITLEWDDAPVAAAQEPPTNSTSNVHTFRQKARKEK